jgi:hypothetical protein
MLCNTYTLLLYIVVDRVPGKLFTDWITVYEELPQKITDMAAFLFVVTEECYISACLSMNR